MLNLLANDPKISIVIKQWDDHLINDEDFELEDLLSDVGLTPEEFLNGLGFTFDEYENIILKPLVEVGSGGEYTHFVYKSRQKADEAKALFLQKHPDAVIEYAGDDNGGICAKDSTGDLFGYLDILQYSLFE